MVSRSAAVSNANNGIEVRDGSTVTESSATANGFLGIVATMSSTVSRSTARGNSTGIYMAATGGVGAIGGSIQGCTVTGNTNGIETGNGVLVSENSITKNSNLGLLLNPGAGYRGNLITQNGFAVATLPGVLNLGDNGCTDSANAVIACP